MIARWTRSARSSLLLAVLAGPPLAAFAAPPAPGARKPDPDELKARTLFSDGQKAYDVGQFQQALTLYSEAYKLKPLPGFLFNIAQCQRQLGHYQEAAFAFGRFIDNSRPEAPNVELARELIDDMRRRQTEKDDAERKAGEAARLAEQKRLADEAAAKRAADAPVTTSLTPNASTGLPLPPPPPAMEDDPFYKKGWFWGVAGVVVAGAVVGTAVALNQPKARTYPTPNLPDINGR